MAAGIVDCKGNVIKVGDIVKTQGGRFIKVRGASVTAGQQYNAELCEVIYSGDAANTASAQAASDAANAAPLADDFSTDCAVWGD